jgi:small conductance mechanosensitive channel
VREIGLFATEFRTADGLYLLAPNSTLWNTPITNYSREKTRKNDLTINVRAGDDVDLAMKTLTDIAKADSRVEKSPQPNTYIDAVTSDKITLTLRYWAKTGEWDDARREILGRVKASFDEKGLPIL